MSDQTPDPARVTALIADARAGHAALPAGAMLLRKPFPPDELARVIRRGLDAA